MEGFAFADLPVPLEVGGGVEAGGGELDALGVGFGDDVFEGDAFAVGGDELGIGELDFFGGAMELGGGEGGEALAELMAGVGDGHAVEIGAGAGGGGGGVGDFVGAGAHEADPVGGEAEFAHGDAEDFGVEALAHFGAAVVHLDGAVGVDEDEGAGLIVVFEGETDAKFDGRDGESAFGVRVGGVPVGDFVLALSEV